MGLIITVGTGQCGLPAIVDVLNRQPDCRFTFHDTPLLPWRRLEFPVLLERLKRWHAHRTTRIFGDAAESYLPYTEELLERVPDARVICLRRPREEVVSGLLRFLQENWPLPVNHWSENPLPPFTHDPVWSTLYPKYPEADLETGKHGAINGKHGAIQS